MNYKPVPEGALALSFEPNGCGDECGCAWFEIRAVFSNTHPLTPHYWAHKGDWSRMLWESSWYWPCEFHRRYKLR
jgi:hypothetical protein